MRPDRPSDDALILALFGDPKESYSRTEFQRLTGTPRHKFDQLVRVDSLERRSDGTFDWQDVALVAVMRWGARRIASVLLRHKREVPPLNQLVGVRVQIPVYQLRALQEEAERKSAEAKTQWGVSDVLTVLLSDWVIPEADADDVVHWPLRTPGE